MCSGLQWTFCQHIVQARITFPRVRTLSGRSVENQEAREKGQGAARDFPRCLNLPGMRTKKKSQANNSLKSLCLNSPLQKSVFLFVTFYHFDECMGSSCCTLLSKKKETRRCRCDAACKAPRKQIVVGTRRELPRCCLRPGGVKIQYKRLNAGVCGGQTTSSTTIKITQRVLRVFFHRDVLVPHALLSHWLKCGLHP